MPDTSRIEALIERLGKHPLVEAAAPQVPLQASVVTPDDDEFQNGQQWNLDNPLGNDADIDAPEAWELNKGRSDVTIAVVDGGVDYNHPDLDPGDRSRIIQGADPADNDGDPMDDIPSGSNQSNFANHGTKVAGVVGAITDNDRDIAGVMWNTQIMPVKIAYTDAPSFNPFLNQGDSFPPVVAEGINYARNNGADVINLSLGRPQPPGDTELFFIGDPMEEAIYNAYLQGIVVVAASGNDSQDEIGFPASSAGAISVGNTTRLDSRYSTSNYGPSLDLVAPGTNYPSTKRGGGVDDDVLGTSFSAPMVSGVAGLILSESRDRNLGLTNDDVQHLMEQTAEDVNSDQFPGRDDRIGHGRVNARKALAALQPPNEAVQASHTGGGSSQKVRSNYKQFFRDGGYFVDKHEVTGHVDFSAPFQNGPPMVWIRNRNTRGLSTANPNLGPPRAQVTNVTKNGFDYKTYVYYLRYDLAGIPIDTWRSAKPSNVKIAYTAIGEPGMPPLEVSLSGPTYLDEREQGTWTASVSGGTGSTSYSWEVNPTYASGWANANCSGSSCSRSFYNTCDQTKTGGIRVTVTRKTQSETASQTVSVAPSGSNTYSAGDVTPNAPPCSSPKTLSALQAPASSQLLGRSFRVGGQDEGAVRLTWRALGSPLPARFVVEHRADTTGAWSQVGTVAASDSAGAAPAGTVAYRYRAEDLAPGTHQFRLALRAAEKSVSGTTEWTTEAVTARIEMEDDYRLSTYPNPVRERATIELAVKEAQEVTVAVYDVLGRRVTTLHAGPLPAEELRRLRLDAPVTGLTSGQYFLRVTGEDFATTEQITVVR